MFESVLPCDHLADEKAPHSHSSLQNIIIYARILACSAHLIAFKIEEEWSFALFNNNQNDRAYILAALEVVDYVVIFDNDDPYELIKSIKPNILVKGGDYAGQEVIGQDIAEELRLVEFIEGKSSTQTIEKIKHNYWLWSQL